MTVATVIRRIGLLSGEEVAQLVKRALAGERRAFSVLVEEHARSAWLTALAVVVSREDAGDVMQTAFLKAFEKLESCREPERFSGWLLRIVRNTALNHVHSRTGRREDSLDAGTELRPALSSRNQFGDAVLRERLLVCLDLLSRKEREVIIMHDLEDWTHQEIADFLGISEVHSRQHLFTARKKLRKALSGMQEDGHHEKRKESGSLRD